MAKVALIVDPIYKKRRVAGRPLIGSTLAATGLYFVGRSGSLSSRAGHLAGTSPPTSAVEANREVIRAIQSPFFWRTCFPVLFPTFTFGMLG